MTEQEFLIELLKIQSLPQENWDEELYTLEAECIREKCREFLNLPEFIEFRDWTRRAYHSYSAAESTRFIRYGGTSWRTESDYRNGDIALDDNGTMYYFHDGVFHVIKSSI